MAIDGRTLAAVARMRAELDMYVAGADYELARLWFIAWQDIASEFELAARELADLAVDAGEWPSRRAVLRLQRVANALKVANDAVTDISRAAGPRMAKDLALILASAEHWQEMVTRTQLPPYGVATTWSRVSADAMDAIIRRSTQRIEALARPLPADVQAVMKSALIRGVAIGDNPRVVASQIMRRCNGAFNGGLSRARTIASTELQDASRQAARLSRLANRDVLQGWRWHSTLSSRSCPSCLAKHGELHDLDEPGPHDHQNGRCVAVPVSKSWRELGFNMDEPRDEFPNARAWFREQPRATQLRIMGKERLRQLNAGELKWQDLSTRVDNPHWRPSYQVTPLTGGK